MASGQRSPQASRPTLQRGLSPSTSAPLVAVQRSSASEHKANGYSSAGTTALLSKVASSPPSPGVATSDAGGQSSVDMSPTSNSSERSFQSEYSAPGCGVIELQSSDEDQYFSFPDFDGIEASGQRRACTDVKR